MAIPGPLVTPRRSKGLSAYTRGDVVGVCGQAGFGGAEPVLVGVRKAGMGGGHGVK